MAGSCRRRKPASHPETPLHSSPFATKFLPFADRPRPGFVSRLTFFASKTFYPDMLPHRKSGRCARGQQAGRPGVFKAYGKINYLYILMPLRGM